MGFWNYIEKFDIVSLIETWIEKEEWEKIKNGMSDRFVWMNVEGKRLNKKGRAKGGILIGVKKRLLEGGEVKVREVRDGAINTQINIRGKEINMWAIYNTGNLREMGEFLAEEIREVEENILIIGGDFNIRIGELGKIRGMTVNGDEIKRQSKDKTISNEGRDFVRTIEGRGWFILNGAIEGDWQGEYTFEGARGDSVIDYVIVNDQAYDLMTRMCVGKRVDSDHAPLETRIKIDGGEVEEERKNEEERTMVDWSEEARSIYESATEEREEEIGAEATTEQR